MNGQAAGLLDELEISLARGSDERRIETLRRVTDLFLLNAPNYTEEQTSVFDDVFEVLVQKIEVSAKALLAERLAPIPTAPPRVVRRLALDDAIEVAAPVLTHSERLTDATLIETAQTKSQGHLRAIADRKTLSSAVTDVLVERGDSAVVNAVVANLGADFSESGYHRLLDMSERDDDLATCVGTRPEIPRHHFVKLLSRASQAVRVRLEALNIPSTGSDISSAVNNAATRTQERSAAESERMAAAERSVAAMYAEGRLTPDRIAAFAEAKQFEETNAAIAMLANVPVLLVETLMVRSQSEGVMIVAKVIDLPWPTVKSILEMRAALSGGQVPDLNFCRVSYSRLKQATAQQVLRFHRMRNKLD
jgi:uncharacterized protein (DUF2336 family)